MLEKKINDSNMHRENKIKLIIRTNQFQHKISHFLDIIHYTFSFVFQFVIQLIVLYYIQSHYLGQD